MNNNSENYLITGLTEEEVRERVSKGQINRKTEIQTKTYKQIVCDNLFSLFNLINVLLLICIIISGSYKNGLFFLVVLWNFLIGTIQEIRAKKVIDRLSILSSPKASVIRNSEIKEINVDEIVLGDICRLDAGNQICADSIVKTGMCQVNESLITGESTLINKNIGDQLLSGSFIVSGQVTTEVIHVGADNYVNKITHDAAYYKKPDSVIMKSLRSIIRWIVIFIIPLTGLFIWNNFFHTGLDFSPAMVKTVAAVSAMIPGGLILLVSIILSVSVVRLSRHQTMIKSLYSVENLARVDTLLLDKTGTITEGVMKVEDILTDDTFTGDILCVLNLFASYSTDKNSTIEAVRKYINSVESVKPVPEIADYAFVPFSSEKKMSMLILPGKGTYILGAPDYIFANQPQIYRNIIDKYSDRSLRVVSFAFSEEAAAVSDLSAVKLPDKITPVCFITIGDRIREDAPKTLQFFREQDVDIKVISGDSPLTVSNIAQKAGLQNYDKWIDATELDGYDSILDAVDRYTIFGRVTPHQKCDIVKALQSKGHFVAMTGDGANDVLALKKADCSIAMQSGTDAARNVANIVLMDSNFASLPLVVAEGRKAINNLQRSASLYLTKTVYSMILTILFIFAVKITYPFESIQLTLIGALTIGVPSFFLALENNTKRIKKGFLRNIAVAALPTGIMTAGTLIAFLYISKIHTAADEKQLSAAAVYLMIIMGIAVIFDLCGRFNLYKIILIIALAGAGVLSCLIFPKLFSFVPVDENVVKIMLIAAGIFFIIHFSVFRIMIPLLNSHTEHK